MLINVLIEPHKEENMFSVTSRDLPGLFLAGRDLSALVADLPAAIKLLFNLNYQMDVQVFRATEGVKGGQAVTGEWQPMAPKYVALPLSG